MIYVIGVAVAVFMVALLVGALTGRVRASHCCAAADPRLDLRMRAHPDGSQDIAGQ